MRVRAFINSLWRIGAGAAWAITVSASFVSSDARSTAATALSASSGASSDASQRRTFPTISACVSPSKLRVGMTLTLRQRLLQHDELEVVDLGEAKTLVAVGKRLGLAGAHIAESLVP